MTKGVYSRPSAEDKIFRYREVDPATGCWNWTRTITGGGYGQICVPGRIKRYAHVVAYELFAGPIPAGLWLDHLCRNRRCCNPAHLEPVTHRENTLRGISPPAVNVKKTHCAHGHEFTEASTYRHEGARACRICAKARASRRSAKRPTPGIAGTDRDRRRVKRPRFKCAKGHELSPGKFYTTKTGARICLECDRARHRRYRAEARASANQKPSEDGGQ